MAELLLEVRTEEIPAAALPDARRQLEERFAKALAAAGYEGVTVRALSTARRLVVRAADLPERQADREECLTGPPARVAFGEDGAPTRAAEGFARKAGVGLDALERVDTDRGEYLAATVRHEGRPTAQIIAEVAPGIITALHFPKTMSWGLGVHHFVRPVHGVVALFDDTVIGMELFGVPAGATTLGHRVHAPHELRLGTAGEYVDRLREASVLVDPEERREALAARAQKLAQEVGCRVHPDPALVAEHVELVEYPALIRGDIDPRFLELPPEVVVTTLRHHQKCLILQTPDGALAPHFLAVVDRADDPRGLVSQGNEWVIGARLADASFFFAEDRKRALADLVPMLERLEFHRALGSLADKAGRCAELAAWLAGELSLGIDEDTIRRAARLVKADLPSHMVGEFPELQGVMGGHYLRLEGASEEVWTAARDHYRPSGFEGALPASELGRVLGVADRLDTVAGLFAVDEVPTGSRDPFGLRRAAQAVVRIVAESGWPVDLHAAIARASALAAEAAGTDAAAVAEAVVDFFADRVRRYLVDRIGVSGDTAEAVMAAGWRDLPGVVVRAQALETVRSRDEFRSLALAFKRVRNITEGQPDAPVEEELLAEPAEVDLGAAADTFHADLERLLPAGRMEEAFAAMGSLAEILDRFFVEVLVMTDDERIRANRIALLKTLGRDFLLLADLSRLQIEGGER